MVTGKVTGKSGEIAAGSMKVVFVTFPVVKQSFTVRLMMKMLKGGKWYLKKHMHVAYHCLSLQLLIQKKERLSCS